MVIAGRPARASRVGRGVNPRPRWGRAPGPDLGRRRRADDARRGAGKPERDQRAVARSTSGARRRRRRASPRTIVFAGPSSRRRARRYRRRPIIAPSPAPGAPPRRDVPWRGHVQRPRERQRDPDAAGVVAGAGAELGGRPARPAGPAPAPARRVGINCATPIGVPVAPPSRRIAITSSQAQAIASQPSQPGETRPVRDRRRPAPRRGAMRRDRTRPDASSVVVGGDDQPHAARRASGRG